MAPGNVDNFIITRDFSRDNEIQARGFLDFFKKIFGFIGLRRDLPSDHEDALNFLGKLLVPQVTTPLIRDSDSDSKGFSESLNAFLQSRSGSPGLTPEKALALALLTRSFDELD